MDSCKFSYNILFSRVCVFFIALPPVPDVSEVVANDTIPEELPTLDDMPPEEPTQQQIPEEEEEQVEETPRFVYCLLYYYIVFYVFAIIEWMI